MFLHINVLCKLMGKLLLKCMLLLKSGKNFWKDNRLIFYLVALECLRIIHNDFYSTSMYIKGFWRYCLFDSSYMVSQFLHSYIWSSTVWVSSLKSPGGQNTFQNTEKHLMIEANTSCWKIMPRIVNKIQRHCSSL